MAQQHRWKVVEVGETAVGSDMDEAYRGSSWALSAVVKWFGCRMTRLNWK